MKRQQGQSAVEFALMAPIIFMMIFGMIYGGIMFMEYMHYSNAVRTAAREIAIKRNDTDINAEINARREWLKNLYANEIAIKMYEPTVTINNDIPVTAADKAVVVTVKFDMEEDVYKSLPTILKLLEFPPRTIKTIEYRMRLERQETT